MCLVEGLEEVYRHEHGVDRSAQTVGQDVH